ncbi:unnamed protein product [Trichobilharzia regenti]|nr:unnamed protein product [Trichobilharzia regenti]
MSYSKFLSEERQGALKSLKNNDNTIILRPDKCSRMVLLDEEDYTAKMKAVLNDPLRFKVDNFQKDKTDAVEKRNTNALRDLPKKKLIDNNTYNDLKPRGSCLPHMYAIPKIHKN